MQRTLGRGELLDAAGHLIDRGWATSETRHYSRQAARPAQPERLKEWDYYCILTPDVGLALTIADNGHMGFLGVSWMDFRTRTAVNGGVALPPGQIELPASADQGDIVQSHPHLKMAFRLEEGGRRLSVEAPDFDGGRGLSGELWLAQPPMDRMVIVTPFADAPEAFYYNQKINCLPAQGQIIHGGQRHDFLPDSAFGVLDWGRGVWTIDNTWYWGSASGLVGGRPFGFNIGYGFGDTSAASENMVFVDGRAHKLAEVAFHLPPGAHDSGPWRFTSSDGRFEMTFIPIVDRAAEFAMGAISSSQHQVFGLFSGFVILDDGSRFEIVDLIGFAEEVSNSW